MHVENVLSLLFSSLTSNSKFTLSWGAISLWNEGVLNLLLENDLIKAISNATNIHCIACENSCSVDVVRHKYPIRIKYYAMCDDPIMHEQMGRMTIPVEQLQQWQCSISQLALVVAKQLDFDVSKEFQTTQNSIRLGMLKTATGRKWVSLHHEPLSLEVNQELLAMSEVLYFEGNKLTIDRDRINAALLINQAVAKNDYAINRDKQTLRKSKTQAMYQDWQDALDELKLEYTSKPKSWLCKKIALLPIAQGKSAETIRKNTK
ncbi:MAG: hypothetical protein ACI9ES_001541 [Oceanospirillaceae bacterium]|jgi:hypothetical protein